MGYIVNISGDSGYTRDDFVTALGGKQDKLVSGTNIKTVGGKSVLGSGNLDFTQGGGEQEYTYDLNTFQTSLKNDAIERINHIKGINPNNNMMVFGLITDLHTMLTKEQVMADDSISNDIKEAWPTTDNSYYGHSCEPSLKLLGAICHEINADAVFCAGDLSSGALSFDCYDLMLGRIKDLFDKYISVPHFITEGNHDRWYDKNQSVKCRTNEEWLAFVKSFNTPNMASYIGEVINEPTSELYGQEVNFPCNTYYVDFPARKVRVMMRSQYEKQQSLTDSPSSRAFGTGPFWYAVYQSLSFANTSDAQDYTVLSVSHYYESAVINHFGYFLDGSKAGGNPNYEQYGRFPIYNNGVKGHAAVGELYGHMHNTGDNLSSASKLNSLMIRSSSAGRVPELDSADTYVFSMFVLDTDAYKLYEIKVGNQSTTNCSASAIRQDQSVSENGWLEYDIRHS